MNTQLDLYVTMVKAENKLPLNDEELALLAEHPAATWAVRARLENQYLRKQKAMTSLFIKALEAASLQPKAQWHLLNFKAASTANTAKITHHREEEWAQDQYLEIKFSKNEQSDWQVDVRISNDALLNTLLGKNICIAYGMKKQSYFIATLSPEEDQLYYHALCEWNEVGVNPDEAIAGNVFVRFEPKGGV
jgi:hypothetical protein